MNAARSSAEKNRPKNQTGESIESFEITAVTRKFSIIIDYYLIGLKQILYS